MQVGKKRFILLGIAIAMVVGLVAAAITLPGRIRAAAPEILGERFASEVEVREMRVRIYPRVTLTAMGVTLRYHRRTDIPPLMTIEEMTLSGNPLRLIPRNKRARSVTLKGVQIHIPPKEESAQNSEPISKKVPHLIVDEVAAQGVSIEIATGKPGKQPLMLDIHRLLLHSFSFDQPTAFEAALSNPKPIGEIDSIGFFGPWLRDDPRKTPVDGTFHFSDADLGTVGGVEGILASTGRFRGPLDRLDVQGDTDTPAFGLKKGRHRVHLTAHYIAVVDGTNGDTELESVDAEFLNSHFHVSGIIEGLPPQPGKRVTLEGSAKDARIEDVLRLVMKGDDQPLGGALSFDSKIEVRSGPGTALDRLSLDGMFGIAQTRFSDAKVQSRVDALSRAGEGQPKNEEIAGVISNLKGRFALRNGVTAIHDLNFETPGAKVELDGNYDLRGETLDFHGHLLLDAKLSQATTGVKSFFLKAADPFLKGKNGGASIPIKIEGTREQPKFGLDLRHKIEQAKDSGHS
jgi:hypothetical protein